MFYADPQAFPAEYHAVPWRILHDPLGAARTFIEKEHRLLSLDPSLVAGQDVPLIDVFARFLSAADAHGYTVFVLPHDMVIFLRAHTIDILVDGRTAEELHAAVCGVESGVASRLDMTHRTRRRCT